MSVVWNSGIVERRVAAAATRGVIAGAHIVLEAGNVLILSPPKTGRIYKRRGVVHQASAPGQPPASDLGGLVASARVIEPDQGDLFSVTALANWSTVYARGLELGTERVDARPYARPALDQTAVEVRGVVAAAIGEELRK